MSDKATIKLAERIWYFIKLPIFIFITIVLIHTFFLTIFVVDGLSMYPTLKDKQILLVNKISYLLDRPQSGDIIILQFPGDPEKRIFVKRVIGIPGDSLIANQVDKFGEISKNSLKLGSGEYYVLGDNRQVSGDSRLWGTVPRENIMGIVANK